LEQLENGPVPADLPAKYGFPRSLILCLYFEWMGLSRENGFNAKIKIEGIGARIADEIRCAFGSLNED